MNDRTTEEIGPPHWGRRVLWTGGLLAVFVLAVVAASATVPRWWAHRVGDQVDGSITQGTMLGLVYGFVFTFLPIIAIVLILRGVGPGRRSSRRSRSGSCSRSRIS